jgi:hypothetical protein
MFERGGLFRITEILVCILCCCSKHYLKLGGDGMWPSGRSGGLAPASLHASDPDSILSRDGLYTLECIPQHFEPASVEILRYIETLIYNIY